MNGPAGRPPPPIFRYLLLKLAARCNLDCGYCYWFRDRTVYDKPKILGLKTERRLMMRLEEHIVGYGLKDFSVLLHGGEPLLFGKARFVGLMDGLNALETRTGCRIQRGITTNGTLLDEEWARLMRIFRCQVTVSVDGPPAIHDRNRIDFRGEGSYLQARNGIDVLRSQGIEPSVLAVCLPEHDPETICAHFVDELNLRHFDILFPDFTYDDSAPPAVAAYYTRLFDLWYERYAPRGVTVRTIDAMARALLGGNSGCEAVGYGPISLVTVLTDGSLEPLDVLRIAGSGSTRTAMSIHTHAIQDVASDPVWLQAYTSSLNLADACKRCEYRLSCGGGYLPHRFSHARGYDNPSVFCEDLKRIYAHIWQRMADDIDMVTPKKTVPLSHAIADLRLPAFTAQPLRARAATRNRFVGLEAFIQRWDRQESDPARHASEHICGPEGRISRDGRPGCPEAVAYTRWDAPFTDAIEEGVRPLVMLLIERFDCITYSSCNGHNATIGSPLRTRHVGVLPRNAAERDQLKAVLNRCASDVNASRRVGAKIRIAEDELEDGDFRMPVLDVLFEPSDRSSGERYFGQLEHLFEAFLEQLDLASRPATMGRDDVSAAIVS